GLYTLSLHDALPILGEGDGAGFEVVHGAAMVDAEAVEDRRGHVVGADRVAVRVAAVGGGAAEEGPALHSAPGHADRLAEAPVVRSEEHTSELQSRGH